MSQEPTNPDLLELTRQLVAAFDRGDVDTITGFGADEVVLQTMGLGLRFDGAQAIRSFLEDWLGSFADLEFELREVQQLANGVVFVLLHQSGSPAGALGSIGQDEAWVIVWADGRVAQLASYMDVDAARADAERLAREPG
jgi:ketosteroid isomerase-like protein